MDMAVFGYAMTLRVASQDGKRFTLPMFKGNQFSLFLAMLKDYP